ncbi:hypothetical protein Peur_054386 [Populus x canadensis]
MGYDYNERGLKWDLQQNPFGFEVFSFNNRAIEKALLLHFLFKSRKFCFLEAGEVSRQRPDNRRDDSTDDGLLIPLCLLIPSHISYFDGFNVG